VVDSPFPIKVKFEVSAGKEVSFSETVELKVKAACITQIVVPIGDKPVDVSIAPAVSKALDFQFLMVRPLLLGEVAIKPSDLVELADKKLPGSWKGILEYSVLIPEDVSGADPDEQRKPLRGLHVFVAGQTEWVTDMLDGGSPGGLKELRFWNNKSAAELPKVEAELQKLLKEDKFFQDESGKPVTGDELDSRKIQWARDRSAITVQIVTGYSPILASSMPDCPTQDQGKQSYRK